MRETRIFAAPVEVREAAEGGAAIEGYAALFDSPYEVAGMWIEEIAPTAFAKSLKERYDDLAVVSFHDADRVLGTTASGTARFSTDKTGLRYGADLDLLDPDGIGMFRKVSSGKVRQSSFAFEAMRDEWIEPDEGSRELPRRILREVKLWEASPVLWGANSDTTVDIKRAVKSYAEFRGLDGSDEAMTITTIREATTETPVDAPPEEAPVATSPPEPEHIKFPF